MADNNEPLDSLKEGMYVQLEPGGIIYEVVQKQFIRYVYTPSAGITTLQTTSFTEIADMEPSAEHLYRVRIGVDTACWFYWQIPAGEQIFGTDEKPLLGYMDCNSNPYNNAPDNHLFEMWIGPKQKPAVSIYNPTAITLTPNVQFVGFNYWILPVLDVTLNNLIREKKIPKKLITIGKLKKIVKN